MKHKNDSIISRTIRYYRGLLVISRQTLKMFFRASVSVLALLCLLIAQAVVFDGITSAGAIQAQVTAVGVLTFQDESGAGAPQELGQKIAQSLQQKINATNKNLLARTLIFATDESSLKAMTVEQLVALGKQSGVKFVVRGAVLAVSKGDSGADTKLTIQLYSDVVSVETSSINTMRAEGSSAASDITAQLSSMDFTGNSPLAQAVNAATEQLAASVSQAVSSTSSQTVASGQLEGSVLAIQQDYQADAAHTEDVGDVEADEELRQLMAQAEALLSSGPTGSAESLKAIGQALNGLKTTLASKADLLEQGKETAQADQEIAARKQELQGALATIAQQIASTSTSTAEVPQPSGEKKNALARINEYMGEALSILQKIQEMRALFRSAREEASPNNTAPTDTGTGQPTPKEEPTAEINGEVMDAGNPVEGVLVTEPESGATATTDSNGLYTLKNVPSNKIVKLLFAKTGKQLAMGRVDLANRRMAVADFDLSAKFAGASAVTIIPSTVLVSVAKTRGASTGTLRGVVRNARGVPLARALERVINFSPLFSRDYSSSRSAFVF